MRCDLILGLLGSGKTTFIKDYINYFNEGPIAIIENDYGAVNVDALILENELKGKADIYMVVGDLDRTVLMRRLKTKLIQLKMLGYKMVICEMSGIFDPSDFFDMLYDDALSFLNIGSVISIFQNASLSFDEVSLYYLMAELSYSNKVVIREENKNIKKEELLNFINSLMVRFKSNHHFEISDLIYKKDLKFKDLDLIGYFNAEYPHKKFEEFSDFKTLYFFNTKCNLDKIKNISKKLFSNDFGLIYRIKGFVKDKDEAFEINIIDNQIEIKKSEYFQDVIIVIGRNLKKDEIDKIFKQPF